MFRFSRPHSLSPTTLSVPQPSPATQSRSRLRRVAAASILAATCLIAGVAAPAGASTTTTTAPGTKPGANSGSASTSTTTPRPGVPRLPLIVVSGGATAPVSSAQVAADPTLAKLQALLPALTETGNSDAMVSLAGRYGALSSALVGAYAAQTGQDVSDYIASDAAYLASLLGSSSVLSITADDTGALNDQLVSIGVASDPRGVGGLTAFAADLAAKPDSLDAKVAAAGAAWAMQLGQVRAPDLANPSTPMASMSAPALMFGLLANRTITAAFTDHPDLFAQAANSPAGNASLAAAWQDSMAAGAASVLAGDPNAGLLNPCYNDLFSSMSTGRITSSGSGCGGCANTGAYLHHFLADMYQPNPDPTTQRIDPATATAPQGWQNFVNPSGTAPLDSSSLSSPSLSCGSPAATSGVLQQSLPGVFAALETP